MKKIIFLFLSFFFFLSAFGQITFQKTYGGTGYDECYSVQQTSDGGYIIAGNSDGFGAGFWDFYLIKTDINGDTLWTKTFGETGYDNARSVQQTTDGGYIIVGYGESFFGGGGFDIYLIKTDTNGNLLWSKTFGGPIDDYGSSVKQTTDGGYIIAGSVGSLGAGNTDVYLIKTDSNGNSLWTKTFGGINEDNGYSVQQTTDGGYVITGGTNSFSSGDLDVYLLKVDGNGNLLWSKTFGGIDDEWAHYVQQTTDGGYIMTGHTKSFGVGWFNIYSVKTDTNGNLLWSKTFGGVYLDASNSVQQTVDGGYIISGTTDNLGATGQDVCLIHINANGNLLWSKTFGGIDSEEGISVQQTSDGGYIITGHTLSFGSGAADVYLIKTDSLGNSGCNQNNPATTITTPSTIVTTPATIITSPPTIVATPATIVGSGGIVTTLCTSVGIKEITKENDSFLSPNPTTGNFKINYTLPQNKEGSLQIIDITGKIVYKQKLPMWSTMQNIALPGIANGIYNCVITCGEKGENKKLVVMK